MPIATPTQPTAPTFAGTAGATLDSGSFTPTAGALMIALAPSRTANSRASVTFTSGFGTVSGWTTATTYTEYGSALVATTIGWAIADGSPGAGVVTGTWSGTVNGRQLYVVEVASGFDTSSPIRQAKNDGAASGTSLTDDFSSTPLSGSLLLSVGAGNPTLVSTAPDTSWTELDEETNSGMSSNVQYVAGSNGTQYGISFGATDETGGIAIAAIEIQEPAAGSEILVVDVEELVLAGQDVTLAATANVVLSVDSVEITVGPQDSDFIYTALWDEGLLVLTGQDISLIYDQDVVLSVDAGTLIVSGQDVTLAATGDGTVVVENATLVLTGSSVSLLNSLALAYLGSRKSVVQVSPSGRTRWVHYIPVKYVTTTEDKVNRYDYDGALAVSTIDGTGLVEWTDYVPVVVVEDDDTGKWTTNDAGFIPVVEVTTI